MNSKKILLPTVKLLLLLIAEHCVCLPDRCNSGNVSETVPVWMERAAAYLDYVPAIGERVVLQYSLQHQFAALLHYRGLQPKYLLYDANHSDVSEMDHWPRGPCTATKLGKQPLPLPLQAVRDAMTSGKSPQIFAIVFGVAVNVTNLRHAINESTVTTGLFRTCIGNDTKFTEITVSIDNNDSNVIAMNSTEWIGEGNGNFTESQTIRLAFLSHQQQQQQQLSISNTPELVLCNSGREKQLKPPRLTDSVVLKIEELQQQQRLLWEATLDSKNKLAAKELMPTAPGQSRLLTKFGAGQLLIIDDLKANRTYYVDAMRRNCTMEALQPDPLFMDANGHLLHGQQLLQLNDPAWRYTGNATVHGVPCQRFLLQHKDQLLQACFHNQSLIGYVIANATNANVKSRLFVQQFNSAIKHDMEFDITYCYSDSLTLHLLLDLPVGIDQLRSLGDLQLKSSARSAVALAINQSPLQVTRISALATVSNNSSSSSSSNSSQLYVTVLAMDKSQLQTALGRLRTAISKRELRIGNYTVVGLEQMHGPPQPSPQPPLPPSPSGGGSGGHSSGAMFLLAIFMLGLGGAVGVLGAWFKWKRVGRNNMPYYVQD